MFLTGKLNVGADSVQRGVEGLTYLLTESSKLMVTTPLRKKGRDTLKRGFPNTSSSANTRERGKPSSKF